MPRDPHAVRGLADKYFAKIDQCVNAAPLPPMNQARQFDSTSLTGFSKVRCNSLRWLAETWFFNEQEYIQHRQHRIAAITMRRGTWLLLGLRRYRDAHGAWPQTLDAISEFVPAEAFSDPTTGEAFIYGLDGDNFKLYSKGPNRIDEGGRRRYVKALKKSEDDISIWPPPVPEPRDESTDDEMLKQMEEIYGKEYMETLRKDKGSDKR
jgi:hypothetical protein